MKRLLRGILNLIALVLVASSYLALDNTTLVTYDPNFVVGQNRNTASGIRRQMLGGNLVRNERHGLLNGIDPTPIIVVQKTDGTLEVTIPTIGGILLSYKDPKPLNIKYVSFTSFGNTTGRWFYDCEETHMEMKKENVTSLERLQVDLFANYSMFTIPKGVSKIYMGSAIKGVTYNEMKSIFQVRLEFKLKWTDPKLQWRPFKYSNITTLRSFEAKFRTPAIWITNGTGNTFTRFNPEYVGIIYNNGSVVADTKQQIIESSCRESQDGNWPWDEFKCSVEFAVDGNLPIDFDLGHIEAALTIPELSKWRFSGHHLLTKKVEPFTETGGNSNSTISAVNLVIHMRRNVLYYRKFFCVPLFVATVFILLSFTMKRLLRGILNLIALVLVASSYLALDNTTLVTYDPNFVVGQNRNTASGIRRQMLGGNLVRNERHGLLNGIDPTPIIVVQKTDGTLEVTIPTIGGILLSYKDPKPLNIKYVSFTSFGNTTGRWFYDCEETHMEMKKENVTSLERLQVDLFANYSMFTIPKGVSKIYMGSAIKGVTYNEMKSIFQVRLEFKLKWTDPKLQWRPFKYSNITTLRSFEAKFRTPAIWITNGTGNTFTRFNPEYVGIIYNNGSVVADTKQQIIESSCRESQDGNWPWDEFKCSVEFAVDGNLPIDFDLGHIEAALTIPELSKWRFSGHHLLTKKVEPFTETGGNSNSTISAVNLVIHMRRNVLYYRKFFCVPLFVATVFILLSFTMKRLLRGILNLIALVLVASSYLALDNTTLVTYDPNFVLCYKIVIGISGFSFFMSILIYWFSDHPPNTGKHFANDEVWLENQHEQLPPIGVLLDRIIFFILFLALPIILFVGL
ncbi:uncharacterized protein LOC119655178 [Hermetia illucens]|nr:uncharacterized protein LOC119655178 [Hermetia illucens]